MFRRGCCYHISHLGVVNRAFVNKRPGKMISIGISHWWFITTLKVELNNEKKNETGARDKN